MLFDDHFSRDASLTISEQDVAVPSNLEHGANGLTRFMATHTGTSYENGLYRIHHVARMQKWTEIVEGAFPDFRDRIICFGFDWLGRIFALDFARKDEGQFLVLMFEPGTGQALEIPASFMNFHNQELVQHPNAALASEFFDDWLTSGGIIPHHEQCIGYKKPLFLNGHDTLENLEVIDMEVYWSIMGQLLSGVRQLRDGTRIEDIHIKD